MTRSSVHADESTYVASADEVHITRDGDYAIIEYADPKVATTNLTVGAERLGTMTDPAQRDGALIDTLVAFQRNPALVDGHVRRFRF